MKTTENSSVGFSEEVKRLFSGMLLGSLLLVATTLQSAAQCVNVGPVVNPICQGETTSFLGGSFGDDATAAIWSTASGGTFANNDGLTPNLATWTPPVDFYGTATLILTASGGTCEGVSDSKQIVVYESPTIASILITPLDYCGTLTTGSLGGNTPAVGTGEWSIFSGGTGTFSNSADDNSTFTADAAGTFVLRWTISNGTCTPSSADVTVNFYENPSTATITTTPLNYCGILTSGALGGNTPAVGTGEWSIFSGGTGTFSNSADGNSTFTADAAGTYVLRWTISNGTCTPSSADVTVNFYENPSTATIVTTPLNYCGILTSGVLGGNTPAVGTGAWSIVSGGTGSFSNSADGNSTFTADAAGTYILRWTISNGTCTPGSADVTVNYYKNFTHSLVHGWNWFSVNTIHENMSLNNILATGFTDGDYIKNQTAFAFYSSEDGWQGSFSMIDPGDLYIVRVENAAVIDFCGTPVNVNTSSIPVVTGWNWVGYFPGFSLPINDALGSLNVATGDYVKNQTGYSEYYGTSWFGSLVNLNPGEGYMMRLTNAGELSYPDSPAKNSGQSDILPADNSFSPHRFEFNGSVTANVILDGIPVRSEKDRLYAYVDDEIRGIAHGLYVDFKDSYIFPLMIHSNNPEGEKINFRYYNSEQNKFYSCLEEITFKADMIISNPVKPFRINIISDNKSTLTDATSDLQLRVFPNPFKDILNIGFAIPEISEVRVTVSDQYGNIVKVLLDQELISDNYTIQWVCEDEPSGMYIIRLQAGNRFIVQKVVVFR